MNSNLNDELRSQNDETMTNDEVRKPKKNFATEFTEGTEEYNI